MGVKRQMGSGVYKVTIGRTTKMGEHEVGNAMGINTWAAFVIHNHVEMESPRICFSALLGYWLDD